MAELERTRGTVLLLEENNRELTMALTRHYSRSEKWMVKVQQNLEKPAVEDNPKEVDGIAFPGALLWATTA